MTKTIWSALLAGALIATLGSGAHAGLTPAQKCQSEVETAAAKLAQCRLKAEATFTKIGDAARRDSQLATCSTKFADAFAKSQSKYGMVCPMGDSESAFDAYLTQCTDDVAAASGGASIPTCAADLASCTADLATANAAVTEAEAALTKCETQRDACQAIPGKLLRTGQTTCWDAAGNIVNCTSATLAQDGQVKAGLPLTYLQNGDGTVTDRNTGLMWELLSDDDSIHDADTGWTWETAFTAKIATLNAGSGFAGYTDWRVPNVRELQSIVSYALASPAVSIFFHLPSCAPGCTTADCRCTASTTYWSSTSDASQPTAAWVVDFAGGGSQVLDKATTHAVRAVRAGYFFVPDF